jgi:hypothetical protein
LNSLLSKLKSRLNFRRPNNLKVVVLSLGTAAIFWFFNALNKEYDTTVGYPVNWQFDVESYIVVEELPEKIRINVKGLGWNLLRASLGLQVKPVTIILNNPAANKKVAGVSLTNRVDNELEDLQLNYILDDTLSINIDKRGKRTFGVYIDSTGISLAENHRVVSPISYDVDTLELEGPISLLNKHPSDSFFIEINEKQLSNNFDEQIDFEIERQELFLFNPRSVHLTFSIAEFVRAARQVSIEQIEFPEDGTTFLKDTMCTVQFMVRKDIEATIVADSFKVVANFTEINKLDSSLTLKIQQLPADITDVALVLPQVQLSYEN